jgi:hypothetical protein
LKHAGERAWEREKTPTILLLLRQIMPGQKGKLTGKALLGFFIRKM